MKKKQLFNIFIALLFIQFSFGQVNHLNQLTTEEKISDFNYLFEEFKASYPYFDINKRLNKTDWLSNKKKYLKKIKKTKTDKDFFVVITAILNDLNNNHTDTYPTLIYDYFYKAYKEASKHDSDYIPYVKELEKTDTIRCKYWKSINSEILSELTHSNLKKKENTKNNLPNITTKFNDSVSTAIISIKSFSYDFMDSDRKILKDFFAKVYGYNNLIIDIQGNEGGDTDYWMRYMIPYLISDTITFPLRYAFKNSERIKFFKPNYFLKPFRYHDIRLPNMPKELKTNSYLFYSNESSIIPIDNRKKYLGNVYLLVDKKVFSSAEMLAYFCKSTKFATVVGERTNGDGVGTDPLLLTLPKSGIVIRFTGEMGLNADGSANEEMKTIPDLLINAENNELRLHKLLWFINKNK